MNKEETAASATTVWIGLREIYRLLGSEDGNTIIRILLKKKNEPIKSGELMEESAIPAPRFYPLIKALVLCQVVEKKVHTDRSVSYSLSQFGKNVLELSEPILEEIKERFKDKDSILLTTMKT